MGEYKTGRTVRWDTSRKNLGVIVHLFTHKGQPHCVVEKPNGMLVVCRIYAALIVVP